MIAATSRPRVGSTRTFFPSEADDQDCLWRRLFLAVYTNHPAAKRGLCEGGPNMPTSWKVIYLGIPKLRWRAPCS